MFLLGLWEEVNLGVNILNVSDNTVADTARLSRDFSRDTSSNIKSLVI